MENKLAITIVALMVAALAAPAVMAGPVDYSATVITGQNTAVENPSGAFNNVLAGSGFSVNQIANSFTLNNSGTGDAIVNAKFLNSSDSIYGLTSASDVIGGSNFTLGNTTDIALSNSDSDTQLDGVPAGTTLIYKAQLKVPAGQALGSYTGTVQLTFS